MPLQANALTPSLGARQGDEDHLLQLTSAPYLKGCKLLTLQMVSLEPPSTGTSQFDVMHLL